jgi:hypothetical protein
MPTGISSVNLDIRRNADGFSLKGGTTARQLEVNSSDVTLVGQQDCIVTLPNYAATTLVASHDYAAKGSILTASAANTIAELTVGPDDYVLTASSTDSEGIAWKSPNPVSTITASQAAISNQSYVIGAAAGALVSLSLPATAAVGSYIKIFNMSANLWEITQGAGQQIHFLSSSTTVGVTGSLQSTAQYDAIDIVCVVANTTWLVKTSSGNFILS